MYYRTIVRIVSAEQPARPVSGIRVSLFDHDTFLKDDLLGTGTTDAAGEASIQYNSDQFVDVDDRLTGVFPDLYVVIHGAGDEVVLSTREEMVRNTPRKEITVALTADQEQRARAGGAA